MNLFSILLIENEISVAVAITQAISQLLACYRLLISKEIARAIAKPEPAQVILLDVAQLVDNIPQKLSSLTQIYLGIPIILLQPASGEADGAESTLLSALNYGASDYATLSQAGLLALGKRITSLAQAWQEQQDQGKIRSSGESLYQALNSNTSQLAIQLISPDNRILAWNRTAERLFGLNRQDLIMPLIENLPLSPGHLDQLKNILDQVRSSGEPLFIPSYALENPQGETYWVQLHLYPIYKEKSDQPGGRISDICLISADITDLKRTEIQTRQYNQELQILLETSRQVSGRLELIPTLEKIVEQTKTLLNADNGRVYFLEKNHQTLQPVLSIGPLAGQEYPTAIPVGRDVIGTVAATAKAVMANRGVNSKATATLSEHLLCVPLITLKEMMGVMVVSRINKTPFVNDDLRFFESIVRQVSSAIYNARRFEETRSNLGELAVLYETSSAIAAARDAADVLNTLIRQMVQIIDVSEGYIVSWDKYQNTGTIQAIYTGEKIALDDETDIGSTLNLAKRPIVQTIQSQQPMVFQLSQPDLAELERQQMSQRGYLSRLVVPLIVKGEAIGWADLGENRRERAFSGDEIRLARMLANQAAVSLENLQYFNQMRQALEETDALYQVASTLTTTQDSQAIMSIVLQEFLRALNMHQGSVIFFDFETKYGVVKANLQDEQPALVPPGLMDQAEEAGSAQRLEGWQFSLRNNRVYERLMGSHQPVVINDTQESLSFLPQTAPALPALIKFGWAGPETLSLLIIPIQMRGEIAGALVAEATRRKRAFTRAEISLGQAMADQLGVGLQNVALYEAEYRRRQQAETLREVSFAVSSSLNLNEVLERILDQLGRVIKYNSAAIHLIEGKRRRIIAGRGFPNPKKIVGLTFPINLDNDLDPGMVAIRKRQPLIVANIPTDYNTFKKPAQEQIRSWMGIPLIARDKVIGLISIDHTEANAYDEDDLVLALAFANQVAMALENARLYEIEVRELERELEFAQTIQEALLPQVVPQIPGLQISGRIMPARHIGGDFFHFFSVGQDQLGVAIGDVSGKGIPAALYMAVAITAIDAQIQAEIGPGKLLNQLNHILYQRLRENKMNIGLQVAHFAPLPPSPEADEEAGAQPRGMLMTVASAGMIAPIGATKYGIRYLPVEGLPVGALPPPEQTYQDDVFLLDPFTTVIFTSDGIVEAQNETRELFGFERLEAAISAIIEVQDAELIAEHIINTAQDFIGQAEQNDDMTVVVVVKT